MTKLKQRPNTIKIIRKIDNITLTAFASFIESEDGWQCTVRCGKQMVEQRWEVSNVWVTLEDMLNVALDFSPA